MSEKKMGLSIEEPNVTIKKSTGKTGWIIFSVVLMLLLILALAAVITLVVVLSIERRDEPSESDSVCLDQGCVQAGSRIKANLNESVDPCQDFYQFSCGNWLRSNVIPSGEPGYGTYNEAVDQNTIFLRQALEQGDDGDVEAVGKARNFYQSCLNTQIINSRGGTPLLELITNTGGWSLIGIPDAEPWSLNSTQRVQQHAYSGHSFFSSNISPDLRNSSAYIIHLSQAGPSFHESLYYNDLTKNALKQWYVTLLTLLNSTIDQDVYVRAVDELVDFETRLAQILVSETELEDIDRIDNRFSLGELYTLWPDFDWISFARGLLTFGDANLSVSEDEPIIVYTPDYFRGLTTLVRETNNSVLQNYARMNFIQPFVSFLGDEFTDALQDFNQFISGTRGGLDRAELCSQSVQSFYPIAVARPYVNNAVPAATKKTVSMMIDYINEAFKERLDGLTWLDETTKERTKEKVDAILKFVAYPDQLFNDDYVNEIYTDNVADPNDFFGNYVNHLEVQFQRLLSVFRLPVDKMNWPITIQPTSVNAFYSQSTNAYLFLSGILVPPFFRADWPDYLNFGGIGVIIGHELTHGFDSQGQGFDKDGIRRQWWTNPSINEFVSRLQCFVDQYSNYESYGNPVNGQLTLAENIADNGGLNTAFQAYRNRMNSGGMDMKLPSLDYTPDQLFFIAYGQLWCEILHPQYAALSTLVNVHSPSQSRVIGPLVNSPEFAEAFDCPVGSSMNPPTDKKCFLW